MSNWITLDTCYLYDGSFDGLLTIVFDCYKGHHLPIKIEIESNYLTNLFDHTKSIETDAQKAKRIYEGIVSHISFNTLYNAYYAFLANVKFKELSIVQYLLAGFQVGPKINTMLSMSPVIEVIKLRKKVLMEAHRLKGLIKFRHLGKNLYYAPIHPEHNVIENIGHHFIKRLPTQNFILHDKNREIAFFYNTKDYRIEDLPSNITIPEYSEEEKAYQSLWRTFFKTIAIEERKNPRLQRSYMPKKYWNDLIEKP